MRALGDMQHMRQSLRRGSALGEAVHERRTQGSHHTTGQMHSVAAASVCATLYPRACADPFAAWASSLLAAVSSQVSLCNAKHCDAETLRHADTQTHRHTDIDQVSGRLTDSPADRQINRQTERATETGHARGRRDSK